MNQEKQVDAARKVFRELAWDLSQFQNGTRYTPVSEYSHKLVSNLFNRDKRMRNEAEALKEKLAPEQFQRRNV